MKIKKRKISRVKQMLNNANGVKGTLIADVIMRNHIEVDKALSELNTELEISDDMKESWKGDMEEIRNFENEMARYYPTYCDDQGNLVNKNGWTNKLESLRKKYPKAGEFYEANEERVNFIMEEEIVLDMAYITDEHIHDLLSADDLMKINFLREKSTIIE